MELNLAWDVKNNRKGFSRNTSQKRWAKESVPPLLNENGELASTNMGKAELIYEFFASIFTGCQVFHASHIPEPLGSH